VSTSDWKNVTREDVPFKKISWKVATEHNGYNIAGLLVVFLVRKYGWKSFIAAVSHKNSKRFSIENISLYFKQDPKQLITDFKQQFVEKKEG
jgi:hypothetical protein